MVAFTALVIFSEVMKSSHVLTFVEGIKSWFIFYVSKGFFGQSRCLKACFNGDCKSAIIRAVEYCE